MGLSWEWFIHDRLRRGAYSRYPYLDPKPADASNGETRNGNWALSGGAFYPEMIRAGQRPLALGRSSLLHE